MIYPHAYFQLDISTHVQRKHVESHKTLSHKKIRLLPSTYYTYMLSTPATIDIYDAMCYPHVIADKAAVHRIMR